MPHIVTLHLKPFRSSPLLVDRAPFVSYSRGPSRQPSPCTSTGYRCGSCSTVPGLTGLTNRIIIDYDRLLSIVIDYNVIIRSSTRLIGTLRSGLTIGACGLAT